MKKIIVRADDLGYSEGVNCGIAKCVKQGFIKCIGVMTNMDATVHGLELLKGEDTCYGLHTNICVGKPLTNPKRIPSIVDENGEFKSSKTYRNAKKDFVVIEEVKLEIEAQYKRFVELTNEQPHYFEGHAVNSKNFAIALKEVADKYHLKFSGFSLGEFIIVGHTKVYPFFEAMADDYDPFKSLKKMVNNSHADGVDMMICHPGYLDDYILRKSSLTIPRTKEVAMISNPEVQKWLEENDVKLITYDEL